MIKSSASIRLSCFSAGRAAWETRSVYSAFMAQLLPGKCAAGKSGVLKLVSEKADGRGWTAALQILFWTGFKEEVSFQRFIGGSDEKVKLAILCHQTFT